MNNVYNMNERKVIVIDIDGVLNNYPIEFVAWVNEEYSLNYNCISELKNDPNYKEIKHAYRMSGYKKELSVIENVSKFFDYIYQKNIAVWVVTSRPAINKVINDTKYWLANNDIFYDRIYFTDSKYSVLKKETDVDFLAIIEDDVDIINTYISGGVKAPIFHMDIHNNHSNNIFKEENIILCHSWKEIKPHFEILINDLDGDV